MPILPRQGAASSRSQMVDFEASPVPPQSALDSIRIAHRCPPPSPSRLATTAANGSRTECRFGKPDTLDRLHHHKPRPSASSPACRIDLLTKTFPITPQA